MKFCEKAAKELLYAGMSQTDYRNTQDAVSKSNWKSLKDWSASAAIFWAMSLLMSLYATAYALCRLVYLEALARCLILLLCAAFLAKRFPRTLFCFIRLFDLSLAWAGIGIALCQPDVRTVTMIAIALILPICFIESAAFPAATTLLIVASFAALGKPIIQPDIYAWSLLNLAIFSVVGLLVGHVINKSRFERYAYAESVRRLAELRTRDAHYDQMTGLKNRRAYSEALKSLSARPLRNCCVVIADINGLKQVNDNCGHEAGDELIIGASECIRTVFEGVEDVYRLGGDEFCVIMDAPKEEALRCLERLKWVSASWKGRYVNGVSISCGIGFSHDFADIYAIVKEADLKMYECKRNYYMATGKDRRIR